jgi:hypothetical protein
VENKCEKQCDIDMRCFFFWATMKLKSTSSGVSVSYPPILFVTNEWDMCGGGLFVGFFHSPFT